MGGTISVIVREKNNETHKMLRWTNSLPHFIQKLEAYNQSPQVLKEYLATWQEMNEDYQKNKATGKYKLNMTEVYIPDSGFIAPYGYGLVVVDLVTNKIMSMQGYSSLNRISVVTITNLFNELKYNPMAKKDLDEYKELFKKLMNENKLELFSYEENRIIDDPIIVNELINENFIDNLLKIKQNDPNKYQKINYDICFSIKFSNFEFKTYPDNPKGTNQFNKDLQSIMELSPKDQKKWKAYLKANIE